MNRKELLGSLPRRLTDGTCYIYALIDPVSLVTRYVGKALDLRKRVSQHLRNAEGEHTRKTRWLQKLLDEDLFPIVQVLELPSINNWQEVEALWIEKLTQDGIDLTNLTLGGEGLSNASQETRQKLSEYRKKLWSNPQEREKMLLLMRSPERRLKLSLANKGRKHTDEHVSKLKQNQPGGTLSIEHRQKISKSLVGNQRAKDKKPTRETIKKISDKLKGNQHTKDRVMPEEEKLQRSLSLKGKEKTLEHREKIRLAKLKYWADKREVKNAEISQTV